MRPRARMCVAYHGTSRMRQRKKDRNSFLHDDSTPLFPLEHAPTRARALMQVGYTWCFGTCDTTRRENDFSDNQ